MGRKVIYIAVHFTQFDSCLCVCRQCVVDKRETIFFPSDLDTHLSECLSAILSGFQSRPQLSNPTTTAKHKQLSPPHERRSSKPRPPRPHPPLGVKREPVQNCIPPPAKRVPARNHMVLSKSSFLSPLPHKMSYSSLIDALHKASRHCRTPSLVVTSDPSMPTQHSHSVFLDHFSTFSSVSVPSAFLSSLPAQPLVVSLPSSFLNNLLRHRAVLSEHNYTPFSSDPRKNSLQLSLPRSLLPSPSLSRHLSCSSSRRLTLCSTCNSLYHISCSQGNLCPTCSLTRTKTFS